MEENALNEDHYRETMELFSQIESYLTSLSNGFPYCIDFTGINMVSLIKACGLSVMDDSESDIERVFQYITMVRDLFGEKLFVFVNIRSFFSDEEMETFIETVVAHNFYVLLIDGKEYNRMKNEERIVIDSDLCVI